MTKNTNTCKFSSPTSLANKLLSSLVCGLLVSKLAYAEQLTFKKITQPNETQFNYTWRDQKDQQQSLQFSLNNKLIFSQFKKFRDYNPDVALRHIEVALKKQLPAIEQQNAHIKIIKYPNEIQLKVSAKNNTVKNNLLSQALRIKQVSKNEYLNAAYYQTFKDNVGHRGIKPNHIRFAKESIELLQPLAQKIYEKNKHRPTRQIVNYILAFIQNIPYADLEDRRTSHGAGFSPPNRLLLENQGDCDSKSVLAISLLRNLFPRLGLAIIFLPNHALIGIQIPYQKTDEYIEVEGVFYVLAEPTGPALLPIAEIAEQSKLYIDGKSFTAEILPNR